MSLTFATRQQRVLEMLEDDSIEEEDKPDALKDLLKHLLVLPTNVSHRPGLMSASTNSD
jgi:hypothetical protein